MADVQIRVSGARELSRALDAAVRRLPAAIEDAEEQGAEIIADEARSRAPRRSGRLASSVGVMRDGNRIGAGAAVEYFWPVHSGTPTMAARPFVTQAADAVEARVVQQFEDAVEQIVQGL